MDLQLHLTLPTPTTAISSPVNANILRNSCKFSEKGFPKIILLDWKVQGLDTANDKERKAKGITERHWYQSFVESQPLIGNDSPDDSEGEDKTLVGVKQSRRKTGVVAQFAIKEQRHRRWKISLITIISTAFSLSPATPPLVYRSKNMLHRINGTAFGMFANISNLYHNFLERQ